METNKIITEAIGSTVVKSAPVGSVALATAWGVSLSDWTLITAVFVGIAQIIYTLISAWVKWRNRDKENNAQS